MSLKSYKEALYTAWDGFWASEGEEEKNLGVDIQELLSNIDDPDAEDYYLWGLCIYSLNQENCLEKSHPYFHKSLEKDETYYLARLYSAHCYHDKGKYPEALFEYLKVNQESLKKEMPIWRCVKLLEQIGFCYVKQGDISTASLYFERVIDSYKKIEKYELVPVQEAYECLPSSHPITKKLKEAENEHFR